MTRVKGSRLVVLAFAVLLPASLAAAALPGSLDRSFGGDGKVLTAFAGGNATATESALYPNGRIVAGGFAGGEVAVARYLPNGRLDGSWGGDGRVKLSAVTESFSVQALEVDREGRVLIGGSTSPDREFIIVRLQRDGDLDETFNGQGWVVTDVGVDDRIAAITPLPGGKILVAGMSQTNGDVSSYYNAAFARYHEDGTLDTDSDADPAVDFGDDGVVVLQRPGFEGMLAVRVLPSGVVVGAGRHDSLSDPRMISMMVVHLERDGDPDPSYDEDGVALGDFVVGEAQIWAIDFFGARIVAGGTVEESGRYIVARYRPNATLDDSFSSNGKDATDPGPSPSLEDVAVGADGSIYAGGSTYSDPVSRWVLVRYRPRGNEDSRFGGDGIVRTRFGSETPGGSIGEVIRQADGRVVATGDDGADELRRFALARYITRTCGTLGTRRDDHLVGVPAADLICGLRGSDTLEGKGGPDVLKGARGEDVLRGGTARDRVLGGPGGDTLEGGRGPDVLIGGPGMDRCIGGPGADVTRSCEL